MLNSSGKWHRNACKRPLAAVLFSHSKVLSATEDCSASPLLDVVLLYQL